MKHVVLSMIMMCSLAVSAQNEPTEWFTPTHFKVEIEEMYPERYAPRVGAMHEFSLTLSGDSAMVYLPYLGQVHTAVFHADGLNFDHKYSDMKIGTTRKRDGLVVAFSMRHLTVDYRFAVTVYKNHEAEIMVQPMGADMCRYVGTWKPTVKIVEASEAEGKSK